MISKLMKAEGDAAKIISEAKQQKAAKVKQAGQDAQTRIEEYKNKLTQDMNKEVEDKKSQDLESNQKRENAHREMLTDIDSAYAQNKDKTIEFIINAVKQVDLDSCLTATQKDCLMKEGNQGR